jgi:hypothetical protein
MGIGEWVYVGYQPMNFFLKSFVVVFSIFLFVACGYAQTNVIYLTNWVTAPANFRVVNEVVYDTTTSPLWTNLAGRVSLVDQGVVIVETTPVNGTTTNAPQYFAIRHYPAIAAEGNRISAIAMRVGVYTTPTWKVDLWDCGTNALVPVITTNAVGSLDKQAIKKERLNE